MDWLENDAGFLMILGILAKLQIYRNFTEIYRKFTDLAKCLKRSHRIGLLYIKNNNYIFTGVPL